MWSSPSCSQGYSEGRSWYQRFGAGRGAGEGGTTSSSRSGSGSSSSTARGECRCGEHRARSPPFGCTRYHRLSIRSLVCTRAAPSIHPPEHGRPRGCRQERTADEGVGMPAVDSPMTEVQEAVQAATATLHEGASAPPARFMLLLKPTDDPVARHAEIAEAVAPLGATVRPFSTLDPQLLVVQFPDRAFAVRGGAAFAAAHRFTEAFDLAGAEPDLPSDLFPEANPDQGFVIEDVRGFPLGCFVDDEPALPPAWAIDAIAAPAAWDFSVANQRPDRGRGIVVAQPDTGRRPASRAGRHQLGAGFRRARRRRRSDRPARRAEPRARHRNGQRRGVRHRRNGHRQRPGHLPHADPGDQERRADHAGHRGRGGRLGGRARRARDHHEPGWDLLVQHAACAAPGGAGRRHRARGRGQLRRDGGLARPVRRVHRGGRGGRARGEVAWQLQRFRRRHLGAGPERVAGRGSGGRRPQARAPASPWR